MKSGLKAAVFLAVGLVSGAALYAYAPELMRTGDASRPANFVEATERLHTAGQPSAAQLGGLRAAGYGLVVNLAPPTSFGSIASEGALVAQTGLTYVNIPVDWHRPRLEDFARFSRFVRDAGERPVLVHCQVNKRASLFTFLYRVVHERAEPQGAYDKVTAIWLPDPHWIEFARGVLKQHGIDAEPWRFAGGG